MEFEWDKSKEQRNLDLRGISFDFASQVFNDPYHLTFANTREDYGEDRFITYGQIAGRMFVVVHTPRHNKTRIISARKANPREQRQIFRLLENQEN